MSSPSGSIRPRSSCPTSTSAISSTAPQGALAIGGTPRLGPARKEEAKQGWDWHNELSALSLELRRILDQTHDDKTRMALLKDMRRVLEKR